MWRDGSIGPTPLHTVRVLRPLWIVVAVLSSLLVTSLPATADQAGESFVTRVSVRHYLGGPIDSGDSQLWRSSKQDIEVGGDVEDQVTVTIEDGGAKPALVLDVAAPRGQSLVPGTYLEAQRAASRVAGHPGLSLSDSDGCDLTGRFTVLDVAADLSRLHLTYEMTCNGRDATLVGEVSVGMPDDGSGLVAMPGLVTWPETYPGRAARDMPVTLVNTGTSPVTVSGAAISSGASSFALTGNPCTTIAPGDSCVLRVGFTPAGPGAIQGALTVADSTAQGHHVVTLSGRGAPGHTGWRLHSDPGDWIGSGEDYDLSPADADFWARGNELAVELTVEQKEGADFSAEFDADPAHPLQAGRTYAVTSGTGHYGQPDMNVSGLGHGGDGTGSFTVHEASYDSAGRVTSFSVTFEQHNDGAPEGLFGSVVWRSPSAAKPVPAPDTSRGVTGLRATPLDGAALLTWADPPSKSFSHTVVRGAPGLKAPTSSSAVTAEQVSRGTRFLATRLRSETSYSWTVFTVYGSGAQGKPQHVTLRGTRSTQYVSRKHPRKSQQYRYSGRVVDVATGRGVPGVYVDIYSKVGSGRWRYFGGRTTDRAGRVGQSEQVAKKRTAYRLVFPGDGEHLGSTSDVTVVRPR